MHRATIAILLTIVVPLGAHGQTPFVPGGSAPANGSTKVDTTNGVLTTPTITGGTVTEATISGGDLSQATVIPQGASTSQPLSFVAGAAVNALPLTGSSIANNGSFTNPMGGALYVRPNAFGHSINQTAATFVVGSTGGCVMGGAQNGQGTGGMGSYGSIDTVTLCDQIYGPPPLFSLSGTTTSSAPSAGGTFVPTTPLTSDQRAQIKNGTVGGFAGTWIVIKNGTNPPWVSWVTSVTPDGSSVNVIGWWVLGTQGYVAPTGTVTADFGVQTKVWARNTTVALGSTSYPTRAVADEIDATNNQGPNADMVGEDIVQLGSYTIAGPAVRARGIFGTDFLGEGGGAYGFRFAPGLQSIAVPNPSQGAFVTQQTGGPAFVAQPGGEGTTPTFTVDAATGNVSVGTTGTGLSPHSLGLKNNSPVFLNFTDTAATGEGTTTFNMRLLNETDGVLELYGHLPGDTNPRIAQWSTAPGTVNYSVVSSSATGSPVIYGAAGTDGSVAAQLKGSGTSGGLIAMFTSAPTTTTIPAGTCGVALVSTTPTLYCNAAGTLSHVALAAD